MKKVGILTFHRAVNYGACLQAFALKHYIEKLGCKCNIIDYHCPEAEDMYNKIFLTEDRLKTKVRKTITWSVQKKRNRQFTDFVEKQLLSSCTSEGYIRENIGEVNDKYDIFIAGSDQVWSPFCTGGDKTYFLDFVNDSKKKFSYAACMGIANDDFFDDSVKNLLQDFSRISVREEIAKTRLTNILGNEYENCIAESLDPTFLLDMKEWDSVAAPVDKKEYIFVYSLSMPYEVVKYAQRLSDETGLEIVYFTLDNLFTLKHKKNVITGTPYEFLGYIKNAKYVVTNSFHGTAFSLIFNREFVIIKNSNPNHDNSRLTNIVNKLGIENRLLDCDNEKILEEKIDYEAVNRHMCKLRDDSVNYIKEILDILD